MSPRRRSKYRGERKAISQESHAIAGVSVFCMIVMGLSVGNAVITNGETANYVAGLSTIAFIASIICLGFGTKIYKCRDYTTASRMVALIFPLLAVIGFVILYGIGLLITG